MARSLSRGPTGRDELIESNISKGQKPTTTAANPKPQTAINKDHKQTNSSGEKQDNKNIIYGNKKGQIRFGHLHLGSDTASNVQSGVMLQALDPLHYMTMDNDGSRKGWTINRCPGPYQVISATDHAGVMGTENDLLPEGIGIFLMAEKGDIVISAPKGRIRLSALDIDIQANGHDNSRGTVNIDSNTSVSVKTPIFSVNADARIRLFSPDAINIISNTSLSFTSNFINGLTSASNKKPDKLNPVSLTDFYTKALYFQ